MKKVKFIQNEILESNKIGKKLLKPAIALLFILLINFSIYSQYSQNKALNVVYIIKLIQHNNETGEYYGATFDVVQNTLIGIITREYYDKNKSRVKSKYPNSKLYVGTVHGKPKVTQSIYVEPYVNDYMQIENKILSRYNGTPELPMSCQKKGEKCSIKTDTSLQVYMYVAVDHWSNSKGYSSKSKYKIQKIKSTGSLKNRNYISNPTQIKFKQSPLITKIRNKAKFTKY